jgi:hypothetical protein
MKHGQQICLSTAMNIVKHFDVPHSPKIAERDASRSLDFR